MSSTFTNPAQSINVIERTDDADNYWVILHNDDVTTFEFVIALLITVFALSKEKAVRLTYQIHNSGSAKIHKYPLELAELKVNEVHTLARSKGYPLLATILRDRS